MFTVVLFMFLFHFLGDFYFQTDAQARNKWRSKMALLQHTCTYTICLTVFGAFFGVYGVFWAVFNGVMHFGIDFNTSKLSHKLYDDGQIHDFFVLVGADQYLHMLIMISSFEWLLLN